MDPNLGESTPEPEGKKGFSGTLWPDLYACLDIIQEYTGDDNEAKELASSRRPEMDVEAKALLDRIQKCITRLKL